MISREVTPTVTSIESRLAAAGLPPLPRLAWLEIDIAALSANLREIRALVPAGTEVAAVLKADGYGHGLEVTARTFVAAGADALCVATLDEALVLRRAGIHGRLLVLFPIPASAVGEAARSGLELVASAEPSTLELLRAWRSARGRSGRPDLRLALHLEVETGLERGGVPVADVGRVATAIATTPDVVLAGLCTHLASPDDAGFSSRQERRLADAAGALAAAGLQDVAVHSSATGGLFGGSGRARDLVRPGLCLYGELPAELPVAAEARASAAALRPAMTLKARPLRIEAIPSGTPVGYGGRWTSARPSVIATLPVGYGDGYSRSYQPGGEALVRGRRAPLVGSVAMDALAVDVTEIPGVSAADEFVLLGPQGDDRITASELARRRTTISWEVLTSMAYRIPRVYDAATGPTGVRTLAGEFLVRDGSAKPTAA